MEFNQIARALPYPTLEDGSSSFLHSSYQFDCQIQQDKQSAKLTHKLKNTGRIEKLIAENKINYGCLVAIPKMSYRKLYLSKENEHTIQWPSADAIELLLLRPVILAVEDFKATFTSEDGIAEVWQNREITFPKGARIASKRYLKASLNISEMLKIESDPDMMPGAFKVFLLEDGRFQVKVAQNLYRFIQKPNGADRHRKSILTHMISRCFEILQQTYKSNESNESNEEDRVWESIINLRIIADDLKARNLPIWDEEGFEPDLVATKLEPHIPTDLNPTDEEDE